MDDIVCKYRILYGLYERIYGFALLDQKENKDKWIFWEDGEEGNYIAELKQTVFLTIDEKIDLHLQEYKSLKKKYSMYNIDLNGRIPLW